MLASRRFARQLERHRRTAPRIIARPQATAVRLDDRTADRQAQADAMGLAGDEGLEDALDVLRCDADGGQRLVQLVRPLEQALRQGGCQIGSYRT
jgi:hypothetical protein